MKPREPTVGLPRYGAIDAYTLEELRREYQNSDAKGRIRLLEQLQEDNWGLPNVRWYMLLAGSMIPSLPYLPYEIALLAIEDQDVDVRQWIARHGVLDYRGKRHVNEQTNEWVYEFPDKNLADRLKKDPDPFVRACLRENEKVYLGKEAFPQANHLERLALVRNPHVSSDLIEKIFDPEDKELGIDLEQRKELVLAYLTNSQNLDGLRTRDLSTLWRLTSKWPSDALGNEVYRVLPNPFEFEEDRILWASGGIHRIYRELDEGMKDPDDRLRFLAYTKVSYLDPEQIKAILAGTDVYALGGLLQNRSLYIASKLYEKLVPHGYHWYSVPPYPAMELGTGNWYLTLRRRELVKVLFEGVTYEFFHPNIKRHLDIVGAFSYLRTLLEHRYENLGQGPFDRITLSSLERRQELVGIDKEIEKVPPANLSELFDRHKRPSQGNFLEDKIDYIGKRLLLCEELIRGLYKPVAILVVIYIAWRLLGWLLGG